MKTPTKEEILEKVNKFLKEEGLDNWGDKTPEKLLEEFILPGLQNSKNTLASLYQYSPTDKAGFVGNLKNKILHKVKNITLNVMERQSMRQQKFNELAYQAILQLVEENKKLRNKS